MEGIGTSSMMVSIEQWKGVFEFDESRSASAQQAIRARPFRFDVPLRRCDVGRGWDGTCELLGRSEALQERTNLLCRMRFTKIGLLGPGDKTD